MSDSGYAVEARGVEGMYCISIIAKGRAPVFARLSLQIREQATLGEGSGLKWRNYGVSGELPVLKIHCRICIALRSMEDFVELCVLVRPCKGISYRSFSSRPARDGVWSHLHHLHQANSNGRPTWKSSAW